MNKKRLLSLLLALVLMITALPVSAFAKGEIMTGMAWITGNKLRLRASASTSSKALDSASKGDVAVVVSKQGKWYKVVYNNQIGYMHRDYLDVETKENVELGYGKINANKVNLRSGAGTSYKVAAQGNKGDLGYIVGINNGWYKIIFGSKICYVRSDYMDLTEIPYDNEDSSKEPIFYKNGKSTGVKVSASALKKAEGKQPAKTEKVEEVKKPSSTVGDKIVAEAKKYLGTPYVWSGSDPSGFDCSGFVYYVYKTQGIKIARTQDKMYAAGTPIEKKDLKPGDIVFFQNTYKEGISHCGIYVGDGQFIHSSTSNDKVRYSDLNSAYYTSHYYGAVRYA